MAHPSPRQVEEVYTIKQVEALTGVSANTIRSWERRHGFPSPQRTGSNYRAYSANDIARIGIVRGARDRGQTVEQAIHALNRSAGAVVEGDVARKPQPTPPADLTKAERLVDELIETRFAKANDLLGATLLTSTIEEACFQLLLPADRDISRRAAADAAPRFRTAIAREWVYRKLVHAFSDSGPDTGHRLAVVIQMVDAQEQTLSLCHAINLSRTGHCVCWSGAGVGPDDVENLVAALNPSVVVLAGSGFLADAAIDAAVDRLESLREDGWNGVIGLAGGPGPTPCVTLPPDARLAREAIERAETSRADLHLVRNA